MNSKLPPITIGRDEASEVLGSIDAITHALGDLPLHKAQPAIDRVDMIRETICEALPGGFSDYCEGCGTAIGADEVVARDAENGLEFCRNCWAEEPLPEWAERRSDGDPMVPMTQLQTKDGRRVGNAVVLSVEKDEKLIRLATVQTDAGNRMRLTASEIAELFHVPTLIMKRLPAADAAIKAASQDEADAGDVDAVDLARDLAEGWVRWNGGECPLHPDAMVEVRCRYCDAVPATASAKTFYWNHGVGSGGGDIIAYRMVKLARAETPGEDTAVAHAQPVSMPSERLVPRMEPEGDPAQLEAMRSATDPNYAPPEAEELQLLRQLLNADGGPIAAYHSATRKVAARLWVNKEILEVGALNGRPTYELAAKGKRRLEAVTPIDPGDLARALEATAPIEMPSGRLATIVTMSLDRLEYIVALLRKEAEAKNVGL